MQVVARVYMTCAVKNMRHRAQIFGGGGFEIRGGGWEVENRKPLTPKGGGGS